jgi:hypothetical protein
VHCGPLLRLWCAQNISIPAQNLVYSSIQVTISKNKHQGVSHRVFLNHEEKHLRYLVGHVGCAPRQERRPCPRLVLSNFEPNLHMLPLYPPLQSSEMLRTRRSRSNLELGAQVARSGRSTRRGSARSPRPPTQTIAVSMKGGVLPAQTDLTMRSALTVSNRPPKETSSKCTRDRKFMPAGQGERMHSVI